MTDALETIWAMLLIAVVSVGTLTLAAVLVAFTLALYIAVPAAIIGAVIFVGRLAWELAAP